MIFEQGNFTLASGEHSNFKIECDGLEAGDWATLALLLVERVPAFDMVVGVPRGGAPFAEALAPHCTITGRNRILVVDDVWTTGESMTRFVENTYPNADNVLWAVAFARKRTPPGVTALFTLAPVEDFYEEDEPVADVLAAFEAFIDLGGEG